MQTEVTNVKEKTKYVSIERTSLLLKSAGESE